MAFRRSWESGSTGTPRRQSPSLPVPQSPRHNVVSTKSSGTGYDRLTLFLGIVLDCATDTGRGDVELGAHRDGRILDWELQREWLVFPHRDQMQVEVQDILAAGTA